MMWLYLLQINLDNGGLMKTITNHTISVIASAHLTFHVGGQFPLSVCGVSLFLATVGDQGSPRNRLNGQLVSCTSVLYMPCFVAASSRK